MTGFSQIIFLNCHCLGICADEIPVWSLIFFVCFMEAQARILCGPIKILPGVLIGNMDDFPGKILILWLFLLLFHVSYKKSSQVPQSLFPHLLRATSGLQSHSFPAFWSEFFEIQKILSAFVPKYTIKGYIKVDGGGCSARTRSDVWIQKSLSRVGAPRL